MTDHLSIKPASLGTISEGTLRTEDLLSAFASELEFQILKNGDYFSQPENFGERDKLNALVGEAQDAWNEDGETLQDEDRAAEMVEELQDALSAFAGPYCYFGAHKGDGSDFGFWPSWSEIEELPVVEGSDEARDLGEDCRSVNDHGNVTVWNGNGEAVLELV